MKKKAIVVIKPKLLTAMTKPQKPERYNSCQRKGWLPHLQQKFPPQAHREQFNNKRVHASFVKSENVYARARFIQVACISETLRQMKGQAIQPR